MFANIELDFLSISRIPYLCFLIFINGGVRNGRFLCLKILNLRNKILFPTLITVTVSLFLVSGLFISWMGSSAIKEAKLLALETAEHNAYKVKDFINPIMDQAKALAGVYEAAIKNDQMLSRDTFDRFQLDS